MMCVLRRVVAIGTLISMTVPARVHGDPAPAADKKQLARQYVEAGLAAQQAGDYDTAVTLYQKAYQLVPHPVLIFNLAQAYRLAGRLKEALTLYKRYVSEAPDGDQAPIARDFIAEIEAEQARSARRADQPARAQPAPAAPAASATSGSQPASKPPASEALTAAARGAATDRGAASGEPRTAPGSSPRTAPASSSSEQGSTGNAAHDSAPGATTRAPGEVVAQDDAQRWRIPLAVAGGGAALLIGAAGVALWANSTYDAAKHEQDDQMHRDSLYDSANTKRHVALGMAGAGLVCGGVAAWLYFRQRGDEHAAASASAHVIPLLGSSGAGLAVVGGF